MNKGEEHKKLGEEAPPTRSCGQVEARYRKYVRSVSGGMDVVPRKGSAWTSAHVNPRPSRRAGARPAHFSGRRASLIDVIGRCKGGRAATPFIVRPVGKARHTRRERVRTELPELMPSAERT